MNWFDRRSAGINPTRIERAVEWVVAVALLGWRAILDKIRRN